MQVQNVGTIDLGGGARDRGRMRDEGLAQAASDRRPDDAHAVLAGLLGKLGEVAMGEHRDLVPAGGEPFREVLDVEGESRDVGPVIVQRHQDLHFGRFTL